MVKNLSEALARYAHTRISQRALQSVEGGAGEGRSKSSTTRNVKSRRSEILSAAATCCNGSHRLTNLEALTGIELPLTVRTTKEGRHVHH